MGIHGEAYIVVVPNSITDGEPIKDIAHVKVARGNSGHRRRKHVDRL